MIVLLTICDLWWLLWLLPFLFALWCWWSGKNKYDKMVAEYDGKINGLNGRINGLEGDLSACGSARADLEGDLALSKGRMREMEAEMKSMKATSSSNPKDIASVASSLASSASIPSTPAPSTRTPPPAAIVSTPAEKSVKKSIYGGIKDDNLQIIEGVGPKMESILKENGVNNMSELAGKSTADIQAILNKYGDKYKIIDPGTWVEQAGHAAKGDYAGMIDLQKRLDGGKDNAVGVTDSKLEKYLIKTGAIKSFKQDDLKAIEGIGPATEKLLHTNGIKTWRELANSEASAIKVMLTTAGSRFALGDPTTWPKQAEMAADGKFDELQEYQDFLDGGKG